MNLIQAELKQLGVSTEQLAEAAGVTKKQVRSYLSGETPPSERFAMILELLGGRELWLALLLRKLDLERDEAVA